MPTYIIEPRYEDGSFNASSEHFSNNELTIFWNNATEFQISAYYFRHNKHIESASMIEIKHWYENQGLYIREKYW